MTDSELETWVLSAAQSIQLTIPEICLPGVLENAQRNFAISAKLFEYTIDDDIEAAPVFSA